LPKEECDPASYGPPDRIIFDAFLDFAERGSLSQRPVLIFVKNARTSSRYSAAMPTCSYDLVLSVPLATAAHRNAVSGVEQSSPSADRGHAARDPSHPDTLRAGVGRRQDRVAASVEAAMTAIEIYRRPLERRRVARHP